MTCFCALFFRMPPNDDRPPPSPAPPPSPPAMSLRIMTSLLHDESSSSSVFVVITRIIDRLLLLLLPWPAVSSSVGDVGRRSSCPRRSGFDWCPDPELSSPLLLLLQTPPDFPAASSTGCANDLPIISGKI